MKGLDLARGYYETYGRAMIHEKFPEYEERIAVGLVGEGSECFGFDDEFSADHDFGAAFCLWLCPEDWQEIGTRLQEEYEKMPLRYEGYPARRDTAMTGHRIGVWEIGEFYRHFLGSPAAPEDWRRWLYLPEHYFAVAVNGEVFRDDAGWFSETRRRLQEGFPEDVRIKKIVARAAVMSQAGQYNYPRCLRRGETVAAQLALAEFVKNGMSMVYLLNRRYSPFYKWMHRGLGELPVLSETKALFGALADPGRLSREKEQTVEELCARIVEEWRRQGLTAGTDPFLQAHLSGIMEKIQNKEIRRLHWLEG